MAKNIIAKKHPVAGFTLIELLVTIVIIGILVGIGVVSYNGIIKQNRQKDLENSLIDAAGKVQNYISKNNKLPIGLSDVGVENSGGVTYTFRKGEFPKFCIEGRTTGATLFMNSSDGTLSNSRCSPISPNIQTITKASCPTELTLVKDARDNNSYYIKKLADNCWMLTNLAYAGGTSNGGTNTYSDVINQGTGTPGTPGTLNNGTADTKRTYTLAKYYIDPTNSNPTIDPTPPSTSRMVEPLTLNTATTTTTVLLWVVKTLQLVLMLLHQPQSLLLTSAQLAGDYQLEAPAANLKA